MLTKIERRTYCKKKQKQNAGKNQQQQNKGKKQQQQTFATVTLIMMQWKLKKKMHRENKTSGIWVTAGLNCKNKQ